MGSGKDSMTPKKPENKTLFGDLVGKLRRKKPAAPGAEESSDNFCDCLVAAQQHLECLIIEKSAEFKSEKGREEYSRKALAIMHTMEHHLESAVLLADEYLQNK